MSAVKLFGKTIHLQSNDVVSVAVDCDQNLSCSSKLLDDKENAAMASNPNNGSSSTIMDSTSENPQTTSKDKEQSETSSSQEENPSKKPDKIIPCPRCKSMDTKFCYFNNYNLNQPRHFCKNCQRYWTAGGSMRNVPVGSGRRKAKNSPHCLPNEFIKPESEHCVPNGSSPQFSCFPAPPWYPAPWKPVFWGYGVPGSCNPQWPCVSASSSHNSQLGKHSREEDNNGTKTRVLTPKTLRIDDPNEAAKSSIWATIGMRNEEANSMNSRGVFGGFQSKDIGEMNSFADGSLVLHANPAAFSRSLRFHERAE